MAAAYLAPAKINLTLEILARRTDGYHGIRSVMVPLDLCDELEIAPAERFSFHCDVPELEGDDNVAVRAVRALGELPARRLTLRKRIPHAAGLGGGSSDAAAVLRAAIDGAFGTPRQLDWTRVARSLGSDVPFFLAGTGALVEGTGERVTPLGALPPWHALVVMPPAAISTAHAYARIDSNPLPQRPRRGSQSLATIEAVQRDDFDAVIELLHNDFQATTAAQTPPVATALEALARAGAVRPQLSGSGASVFALARTRAEVDSMLERLELPEAYRRFPAAFAATPLWRK